MKSNGSCVVCMIATLKTSDGTSLCFIKNVEGSQALSTDEYLEIAWLAKGTAHSVNPNTGLRSPLTFERMRTDVNAHSSKPTHTRNHHYYFLGSQKKGARDTKGFLHRRLPNRGAGEIGVSLCLHASSPPHMRTYVRQAPTRQACVHVRCIRARSDLLSVQMQRLGAGSGFAMHTVLKAAVPASLCAWSPAQTVATTRPALRRPRFPSTRPIRMRRARVADAFTRILGSGASSTSACKNKRP